MSAATLETYTSEFAASMIASYSFESNLVMRSFDHAANKYFDESPWCTTFPTAPTLTNGSASDFCFWYDDKLREVPFNPITSTCKDTGIITDYAVTLPAAFDPQYVKVSVNPYSKKISVTGLSSMPTLTSITLTTITVIGTLPDGKTQ